jgi:thiol-disulfide isomerase/thioredoxin
MDDAKKADKQVLMLFTATWCPHCKTIEKILKEDKKKIEKTYNILTYDIESKRGKILFPQIQSSLKIGGSIPVTVIIDPKKDKIMKHRVGSMNKEEFLKWIK